MKHLDRITETAKVQERINALESATDTHRRGVQLQSLDPVHKNEEILIKMLHEYKERREYLNGAKEYMVHFEGGGWNTCYGQDEVDAKDNAEIEYPGTDGTCVVRSVSLANKASIEAAMRNFY